MHCAAGVSRSGTIVIAYIMWKKQMLFKDAIEFVRARRDVVCPNPGFLCQLYLFERDYEMDPTREIRAWRHSCVAMRKDGSMAYMLKTYAPWGIIEEEEEEVESSSADDEHNEGHEEEHEELP